MVNTSQKLNIGKGFMLTDKRVSNRKESALDIETPARDVTAPKITKLTSASGTYKVGDEIEIAVKFSEVVIVNGKPVLKLDIGGVIRTATYLVVRTLIH